MCSHLHKTVYKSEFMNIHKRTLDERKRLRDQENKFTKYNHDMNKEEGMHPFTTQRDPNILSLAAAAAGGSIYSNAVCNLNGLMVTFV